MGNPINIAITNRQIASVLSPKVANLYPCVAIRITSLENFLPLKFADEFVDRLELRFGDIAYGVFQDVWGNVNRMQESHALQIKNFVDRYKDKVSGMLVHCDGGLSRSPTIAYCIAHYLGDAEKARSILTSPTYSINSYVRDVLGEVLGIKEKHETMQNFYEKLFGAKNG
jgi:predicted protein tyrosine phosphatase